VKRHPKSPFLFLAVAALFVAGCSSDDEPSSSTTSAGTSETTAPVSDLEGTLTVSAAASLTDAFTEIGDDFMADNPDVEATFNFDSSSTLVTQITEGAPADVVASADEANMGKLTGAGLIAGEPEVFARNELVIVTKPGNPEGVESLADLADVGVVSLCAPEVPCGKYADQILTTAGVSIPESSVTRGQNVTATLGAVTEGDAVAGIVYKSDVVRAGDAVEAVTIPAEQNVIAVYPIGVVKATADADAATAFMDHVLSPDGQDVLARHGFLPAS
jgi:molybdate transport system substrate-binding protein